MTNRRREKAQPPVFTEADKKLLALMEDFRVDMRVIEHQKSAEEMNSCLSAFANNPLQFKYMHYDFLFKVWLAGHSKGESNEVESPAQA